MCNFAKVAECECLDGANVENNGYFLGFPAIANSYILFTGVLWFRPKFEISFRFLKPIENHSLNFKIDDFSHL